MVLVRMTLRQLECFSSIARMGSIAAAAESLHISRTSVTDALDSLEKITGTQLCVRSRSTGVELTVTGEDFLTRAEDILAAAERLESPVSDHRLQGALSVGCFSSLAPTVLPAVWAELTEKHPGLELTVTSTNRDEMLAGLNSGIFDVILGYNLNVLPGISAVTLYDTQMYALLSADHRLAEGPVARIEDLAEEPLLLMDVSPSREDILSYFAHHTVTPQVRFRSPHFELIRSLVARGLGYSLFIQRPAGDQSYEGLPLACLPLDPPTHVERTCAAWSRKRPPSALIRAFVSAAQRHGERLRPSPDGAA